MNYNKHKNNYKIKGGVNVLTKEYKEVLDKYIPLITDYKIDEANGGKSNKIPEDEKKSIPDKISLYKEFYDELLKKKINYDFPDLLNIIYNQYARGLAENNEIYYEFRRVEYLYVYYLLRKDNKEEIEAIHKLMKAIDDSVKKFTDSYLNNIMPLLSSIELVKIDSDIISDFISKIEDFENEISLLLHILIIRKNNDETLEFFKFKKNLYRLFFLKEIIKAKEKLDKFKTTGEKSKFKTTASKMKCYSYDNVTNLPLQKIS